ncbi:group II intron maturase-specific domain-containing protein [Pseudoalteromonas sp. ZZD1]
MDLDHWIRRRVRMCYWRQWRSLQRNNTHQSTQFNEIGC